MRASVTELEHHAQAISITTFFTLVTRMSDYMNPHVTALHKMINTSRRSAYSVMYYVPRVSYLNGDVIKASIFV